MRKVPKKLRKALRRLPKARKIQGHRHNIAAAVAKYVPPDLHPRSYWRGPW